MAQMFFPNEQKVKVASPLELTRLCLASQPAWDSARGPMNGREAVKMYLGSTCTRYQMYQVPQMGGTADWERESEYLQESSLLEFST